MAYNADMKITLCGSIGFYEEMKSAREKLLAMGHEVKIPEVSLEVPAQYGEGKKIYFDKYVESHGGMESFSAEHEIWDLKEQSIRDHFQKIEWADAIVVVNHEKRGIEGYVGGNTLIEVGVAFYLKKKIYILNSVSDKLSYKQEILGMKPLFLKGEVELLK